MSDLARQLGNCKCAFVDVGANDGTSVASWPYELVTRLKGQQKHAELAARLGECLQPPLSETCFFGFEANPAFDGWLIRKEASLRARGLRVRIFNSTALGLNSQPTMLFVPPNEPYSMSATLAADKGVVTHGKKDMPTVPGCGCLWTSTERCQKQANDGSRCWSPCCTAMQRSRGAASWSLDLKKTVREAYEKKSVASEPAGKFLRTVRSHSTTVALKLDVEGFGAPRAAFTVDISAALCTMYCAAPAAIDTLLMHSPWQMRL